MTVGEVTALLKLGRALACGDHSLPGASGPRSACLVARQALEQVLIDLLDIKGLDCAGATMQTRLICLRQIYAEHPDLVYRAETSWWRLSAACHHHAFELDPAAAQARALIDEVSWLHEAVVAHRGSAPELLVSPT